MNNKLLEELRVFLLDMASRFEDTGWGRPPEDGDKERMERALALFDELNALFNHGQERGEREEVMWWVIKEKTESEILLEKVWTGVVAPTAPEPKPKPVVPAIEGLESFGRDTAVGNWLHSSYEGTGEFVVDTAWLGGASEAVARSLVERQLQRDISGWLDRDKSVVSFEAQQRAAQIIGKHGDAFADAAYEHFDNGAKPYVYDPDFIAGWLQSIGEVPSDPTMNNRLLEELRTFLLDVTEQYENGDAAATHRVRFSQYTRARALFASLTEVYGVGEPGHKAETWAAGECHDCGDPAPVGLYQCHICHARARKIEWGEGQ